MKTFRLTGQYVQFFSVIVVHPEYDEDEITQKGYLAFETGEYTPEKISDVQIDEIEQLEGNTDPEDY